MFATIAFAATATMDSPYDFKVKDIDGKEVDLGKYKGKVVLVVNVASQCGRPRWLSTQTCNGSLYMACMSNL